MKTESPFAKIPSQLDQIPEATPVVFISYSWDSDLHKQWVAKLSRDLREQYRVYTLLDQYNCGGYDIVTFMQKGLEISHRVLIIGTPTYKEKISKSGGARFEDQVISIQLYKDMGTQKFIPVLRDGSFTNSFNELIETRTGYDLRNDADYDKKLQELAADIWGQPMNAAPVLGPKPNFTPASQVLQPVTANTPQDFATIVKSYLLDRSKQILLAELIEKERDDAFHKILEHASYSHQTTPDTFGTYLAIHQDAISKLMSSVLPIVRYGTLQQQKLLIESMVRLCIRPFKNGEITAVGTENVHLLASTFLYHATGVAAIKYGRFNLIKLMMETKVPAPNVFSPSYTYSLEYLAGCTHWNHDGLNYYLQAKWIYPYSQMVMSGIKTDFGTTFIDDNDFQNCYYVWEHLASLLCGYYKCYSFEDAWFPMGGFVNKRISILRKEEDFYTDFFMQSNQQKDNWAPIKSGLFGGQYKKYEEISAEAESFYRKHGSY